jgi:hypothetical protein
MMLIIGTSAYAGQITLNDQQDTYALTPKISYLPIGFTNDLSGVSLAHANWQPIAADAFIRGTKKQRFLLRIDVANRNSRHSEWYLNFNHSLFEKASLWVHENGAWQKTYKAGSLLDFNIRPFPFHQVVFPITVAPQSSQTYLIDVKSTDLLKIYLSLFNSASLSRSIIFEFIFHGICLGVMLAMMAYNLLLFIACREKDYFYFSLFTLSIVVEVLVFLGLPHQYFWPDQPYFNKLAIYAAVITTFGSSILFAGSFFKLSQLVSFFHQYYIPVSLGSLSLIAGAIFSLNVFLVVCGLLALLVCLWGLVKGIRMAFQKSFMSQYFTLGWFTFSLGSLTGIADAFALLPPNTWMNHFFEISMVVVTIFYSFALGAKFAKRKDEKLNFEMQLLQQRDEADKSRLVMDSLFHIDTNIPFRTDFNLSESGPLSDEILSAYYISAENLVVVIWAKLCDDKEGGAMLKAALAGAFQTSLDCYDWGGSLRDNLECLHNHILKNLTHIHPESSFSLTIVTLDVMNRRLMYMSIGHSAISVRNREQTAILQSKGAPETVDLTSISDVTIGLCAEETNPEFSLMSLKLDLTTETQMKVV